MSPKKLNIIDVTVKEGGFRINHCFLPEQVQDIAAELERANVEFAEICHGCGIGSLKRGFPGLHSDKILLKAAKQVAPKLKLAVYISGSEGSELEMDPIKDYFDLGRVGISVHEPEKIETHISKLKKMNKTAVAQIHRIHLRSPEETAHSAKRLKDCGADLIYLVDTFSSMTPEEVSEYVTAVREEAKTEVGFQGRNHTGRALENSMAAVHAGAQWLDGSILGMGIGGGITNLELLTHWLQTEGKFPEIDLVEITRAAKNYVYPAIRSYPYPELVHLLFSKYKMDFYPDKILAPIADILDLSLEDFLKELRTLEPDMVQLKKDHLRGYLTRHQLDLDVVLHFLQTGKVPQIAKN